MFVYDFSSVYACTDNFHPNEVTRSNSQSLENRKISLFEWEQGN